MTRDGMERCFSPLSLQSQYGVNSSTFATGRSMSYSMVEDGSNSILGNLQYDIAELFDRSCPL